MKKSKILTEGKHWPVDYIKTGINLVKASQLGKQSWYNDSFIQQDMQTFADEFSPLSHKNSNLGFFSTIVRWFIEYSGTSKDKYQEFIERKLDGIIGTLQLILNDPSYDKIKDEIKTKWTFKQFEELQKKINDENKKSSNEKLKNIVKKDDYELIPIYSYEELNKKFGGRWTGYRGESEWCHANGKSTYDSWTKNGTQMFFVLAKKNWKRIFQPEEKPTGKDYNAYDNYGLSLIAILVDVATGNLLNETLRWNHVIDPSITVAGATVDKAFKNSWGELSQAVGMDVKTKVLKQIKDKQDEIKDKQKNANDEAAKILKNAKIITDVTIPKEIRSLITDVVVPNSVKDIGYAAFSDCTSLKAISILDSVKEIGYGAFYGCTSLKSISIPDSVESIRNSAFRNCASLENISIPDSVKSIGDGVFYECTSLISIAIPDSVKDIGYRAFYGCESLKTISIPDSVKSIGDGAFFYCESLTTITIPDSVKSIGDGAFFYCESLTTITIPNSVKDIGYNAFNGCASLESISIPNSVKSIGDEAFNGCTSLKSISIPDSVKDIGYAAFSYCTSLKEVIFEGKTIDEVKSMKNYPFWIKDESIIKAKKTLNERKYKMKTYKSKSGKEYTKKQIAEAIEHWKKVLNEDVEYYIANKDGEKTGKAKYIDVDPEAVSKMANKGKIAKITREDIYDWIEKKIGKSISLSDEGYEEILYIENDWNAEFEDEDDKLDEARHDGIHLSNHPSRRNASEKPTIYYLAVDMSDDITNYGQYIRKDGSLTDDMSNNSFRDCAVTQVPESLKKMIDNAVAKYGDEYHIFVYHQPYSYGTQTHKNHARPAVIDVWYPRGKYWRYNLDKVNALNEATSIVGLK